MERIGYIFRPSRALVPFAVVFLGLIVFITIRIFAYAPLNGILLLPFTAFAFWWFSALLVHTLQLSVTISERGIEIERPAGGFFETEAVLIEWQELADVEFKSEKEFNPRSFTGRISVLKLHLKDKTSVQIDQVTLLDHYPDLFSRLQEHVPFLYELPEEQLWDSRVRFAIVGGVAFLFMFLLFIFIR